MSFIFQQNNFLHFKKWPYSMLLVMLGVSLVLGACGEEQTKSTDLQLSGAIGVAANMAASLNPALRWLKGIPCRPPCWEGITPGQTTAQEAVEILKRSPIIDSPQFHPHGAGIIVWKWQPNIGFTGGEALFEFRTPREIIYAIHPSLDQFKARIKLKDVIREYGEPSYAITLIPLMHKSSDHYAYFYWVSLGLQVESIRFSKKTGFNEDLEIKDPNFFPNTEEGFKRVGFDIAKNAIPWEGFKDFDFYCWQKGTCGGDD